MLHAPHRTRTRTRDASHLARRTSAQSLRHDPLLASDVQPPFVASQSAQQIPCRSSNRRGVSWSRPVPSQLGTNLDRQVRVGQSRIGGQRERSGSQCRTRGFESLPLMSRTRSGLLNARGRPSQSSLGVHENGNAPPREAVERWCPWWCPFDWQLRKRPSESSSSEWLAASSANRRAGTH